MKLRIPILCVLAAAALGGAAFLLLRTEPVRPEDASWAARLGDPSIDVRSQAVEDLLGEGPAAVPVLVPLLRAENTLLREMAVRVLGILGPAAEDAVPALVEALSRSETGLRRGAIHALGRIGPAAAPASASLGEIAADDAETTEIRFAAVQALHGIGPAARAAAPDLRRILETRDPNLRALAAGALGRIDPEETDAMLALIDILNGPAENAIMAAMSIAEFGDRARTAVPLVERLLEEAPPAARPMLAFALARIDADPEPRVRTLAAYLASDRDEVRRAAVMLLGDLGPTATPAIPALERLVDHPELGPRARRAIGRIRGDEETPR